MVNFKKSKAVQQSATFLSMFVTVVLIFCMSDSSVADVTSVGALNIRIVGLKNNNGVVYVTLFNSKESYFKQKYKEIAIQPDNNRAIGKFENLSYGEYAISVIHDENGNGKLNTNLFRIPKEPYGFSNNASATFGPPKFEEAAFAFNLNQQSVEIRLR